MATPRNDHIIHLPTTSDINIDRINATEIAKQWLAALDTYLMNATKGGTPSINHLFHQDSWWRDMLVLTWDFRTIKGIDKISDFILRYHSGVRLGNVGLDNSGNVGPKAECPVAGLTWITACFSFSTRCGRGSGVVYLTPCSEDGDWKAYSVYTALDTLNHCEERLGTNRPEGTIAPELRGSSGQSWAEQREKKVEFRDTEPTVLVVGAGQSGLNLAARLKALGQSCLIVDKNERVGDNWRKRYKTLVTHDHVETCHMAYLPFPKTWPKYLPKDKLADWLESYASIMDLNVWTKASIISARYCDEKKLWTVTLDRNGTRRVLHPRHIAWCAGLYGIPKPLNFKGLPSFKGIAYHGSKHEDAAKYAPTGKRVIVVGTGNSGHDIAEDYSRHGANVTMLQRGETYVLTTEKGLPLLPENIGIDDDRTPLDVKDILSESLPWPVTLALAVDLTKQISEADRETLVGLEKAGFKLGYGLDGAGILRLIVTRAGGYYIDVGCSKLIIDGKIKMKHAPGGITAFDEKGIVLADGDRLDAHIVVLATGYENMHESVRRVLGEKVADRCNPIWDLDEEGELRTIWRPSGHPGLWFMAGSLSLCRIYSKFVALQIVATELGLT
ncbi:flavin-containing monooxygenase [Aspergillus stella-maris]|uniref:flavin-containing monooxygenase n=1 Tax=Aspergillus stella-maris TaxID=1810926 RepID=UPI003CCD44EC